MLQEKTKNLAAVLLLGTALSVTLLAHLAGRLIADPSMAPVLDNLHWTLSMLISATMAWIGMRTANPANRVVRTWVLIGMLGVALGQLAWDLQMAIGWNPFPAPSDALYMILGLGLMAAMASEHARHLGTPQFRLMLLDTLILAMPALALALAIYLPRIHTMSTLGFIVTAAYPAVMFGAACLGFMVLLYLRPRLHWSWLTVVIATLVEGVLWMHWSTLTLYNQFEFGTLFNLSFSIVTPILALGAMYWEIEPTENARYRLQCEVVLRILPLFSVAVATLAVVLTSSDDVLPSISSSVQAAALIIIIAAAVRQRMQLAEHERLQQTERALLQSEIQFQSLIDASPVPYSLSDAHENVLYLNAAFTQSFGYTLQDVPTLQHWRNLAYPDAGERERVRQLWIDYWVNPCRETGQMATMELNIRCKNGETRTVLAGGAALSGRQHGQKLFVLQDITDRKRIEAAEKQNAERYRSLTELAPFPIVMIDQQGTLIYGNHRARLLFEVPADGLQSFSSLDFYVNHAQRDMVIQELQAHGAAYDYELDLRTAGGRVFAALASTQLVEIEGQGMIISCINDISARKQAELALHESARRYQELIESVAVPIAVSDLDTGNILYANKRAEKLFRANRGAGIGVPVTSFYAEPDQRQQILDRIDAGDSVVDLELRMRRTDGTLFWAQLSATAIEFDGKRGLLTSINDIDSRKQAEVILRDSARRYRNLIDASPFPIVVTEISDSALLYANQRAEDLFGGNVQAFKGHLTTDFFVDPQLNQTLRSRGLQALKDGAKFHE